MYRGFTEAMSEISKVLLGDTAVRLQVSILWPALPCMFQDLSRRDRVGKHEREKGGEERQLRRTVTGVFPPIY